MDIKPDINTRALFNFYGRRFRTPRRLIARVTSGVISFDRQVANISVITNHIRPRGRLRRLGRDNEDATTSHAAESYLYNAARRPACDAGPVTSHLGRVTSHFGADSLTIAADRRPMHKERTIAAGLAETIEIRETTHPRHPWRSRKPTFPTH